jgi:hypothetical protein
VHVGYCMCMLVIHVHVSYLWFKQHIKDACKSREHQLPNIMYNNGSSMEIQYPTGNIEYKRQSDLMDQYWNTIK